LSSKAGKVPFALGCMLLVRPFLTVYFMTV
jgi:hypothetical protein